MVMHARKYPRLNDGYYERGQAHPGEAKAAPKSSRPGATSSSSSSQYSEHYPAEKPRDTAMSYNRHRVDDASSRYPNKASYKEKANHSSTPTTDRRSKPVGSNGSKNSREQREREHRVEVQRSAIHHCGDWTEHRSSSGKRYYYNCKTEQSQWEKPKDWVDLPHRLKEAGKERQIKLDSAARHSHSNDRSDHRHGNKTNSVASWSRALSHSSNDSSSMSNTKCAKQRPLTSKTADNGDLKRADLSHHVTSAAASSGANGVRTDVLPPPHSSSEPLSRFAQDVNPKPCDSAAAAPHPELQPAALSASADDMDISPGSTPTEESMMERGMLPTTPSPRGGGSAAAAALLLLNSSSSSSSLPQTTASPSVSTPSSRAPFGVKNSAAMLSSIMSLPNMPTTEAREALQKIENQQITQQAIHTLQKIQQALLAEQQQQQRQLLQLLLQQLQTQIQQQKKQPACSTACSTSSSAVHPPCNTIASMSALLPHSTSADGHEGSPADSDGTPLQSPEPHAQSQSEARLQEDSSVRLDGSPRSDSHSLKSAHSSPAPSISCAGGTVVQSGVSQLMAHRKQEVGLTPSLANYVNPKLMEHVSGWLIDPLEVQANKLAEDSHTIGSIGCAQVSGELKQARSLVRITEIEATLHEQRVLFMRQQIKDLEAMRSLSSPYIQPPSSSSSSTSTTSSSLSAVPLLSFKLAATSSSLSSPTIEHR